MPDRPSPQKPSLKKPSSKKTELIEVRVSHETKREFLAACQRAGRTASDVVREGIDRFMAAERFPAAPEPAAESRGVIRLIPRPMRRKRWLAAGAGAAALAVFAALPSAAAPDFRSVFVALDANKDGVLSADEFADTKGEIVMVRSLKPLPSGQTFPRVAKDGEKTAMYRLPGDPDAGVVVRREAMHRTLDAAEPPTLAMIRRSHFASMDANKDGKVELEEFVADRRSAMVQGFTRLDADQDGAISAEEYRKISQPVMTWPVDMDTRLGVTVKVGALLSDEAVSSEFARLDADRDGKLSRREYLED